MKDWRLPTMTRAARLTFTLFLRRGLTFTELLLMKAGEWMSITGHQRPSKKIIAFEVIRQPTKSGGSAVRWWFRSEPMGIIVRDEEPNSSNLIFILSTMRVSCWPNKRLFDAWYCWNLQSNWSDQSPFQQLDVVFLRTIWFADQKGITNSTLADHSLYPNTNVALSLDYPQYQRRRRPRSMTSVAGMWLAWRKYIRPWAVGLG